jgi:serine/threonine protein kinase
LTSALEEIHALGYVHGDLKPENICIKLNSTKKLDDFNLCLIDFGLSYNFKNYKNAKKEGAQFNGNYMFASKT